MVFGKAIMPRLLAWNGSLSEFLGPWRAWQCSVRRSGSWLDFPSVKIRNATGMRRDTIRQIRHGKGVKRTAYLKVINFLTEYQPRMPGDVDPPARSGNSFVRPIDASSRALINRQVKNEKVDSRTVSGSSPQASRPLVYRLGRK